MAKLSTLPSETTFALADSVLKVKAGGAGDVLVTLQNLINQLTANSYNPYKFRVYLSAATTSASLAFGLVPFDTKTGPEGFDTGNNVDVVTNKGRFTAPIAGFYMLTARTSTAQSSGTHRWITALYKNGVEATRGTDGWSSAGENGSTVSDLLQLSAGDYIETYVYADAALSYEITSPTALNHFSGYLVSAT